MQFTGERFVPQLHIPEICYEHWHRYQFADLFCEGRKVLDIASGEGYGSHFLSQNAQAVVGVDISQESVDHASSRYRRENLTYMVGEAGNIPIEVDHSFDVVVSFETIEHIDEEQQRAFLAEVKRLLAPKGVFIVSTPNKALYSDAPHYKNEYHIKEFYEAEFREFLGKRFANIVLLGQKVETGSRINHLTEEQNAYRNFRIRDCETGFHPVEEILPSQYFLAVCSDALLPNIPSSFCTDLSNRLIASRDERIAGLEQSLQVVSSGDAERNRTIQALSAQIAEQDRPIQALLAQIAERDRPIQTLSAQIAEQDRSIQSILTQLTERNLPIEALSAQIADQARSIQTLSAQIAEIKRSKAWKIALIFRKIRVTLAPPKSRRARALGGLKKVLLGPVRRFRETWISTEELALIKSSGLFDENWYLARNPDVAREKINPLHHYLHHGGFEGRDPGPNFSSDSYLNARDDVKKAGINPLVHYLRNGDHKGICNGL
jgi:SAM-dependent methyltransferase